MNISTQSLDSLGAYLKMHADTLKAQTTSMKDGKPNPSYIEQEGREKISKRTKTDEKKISAAGEKIDKLKSLDSNFKNIGTSLSSFAGTTASKSITSPHGVQGTAAAGAAYETKHVTINKKASNCVWTITPRDFYSPSSWVSETDVVVSNTGEGPKIFDISGNPDGPHLIIEDANASSLKITLTDGMTLQNVVDAINNAISGDGDFNGRIEAFVLGPPGRKEIVIKSNGVGNGEKFSIRPLVIGLTSNITMTPNPENITRASFLNINGQPWGIHIEPPVLSQFNEIDVPNKDSGTIILNGHEMTPGFGWDPATASIDDILDQVVNFVNDETINTGVRAEKIEKGLFRHIEFISIDGRGIDFRNTSSTRPFAPVHAFGVLNADLDYGAQITIDGTKFYSDDDAFPLPDGNEINVSGVIMPASGDALATTYSVVPQSNWSSLVENLVKYYNDAVDFIDSVENEVDDYGVHTSPLYASREIIDLRNLIRNIKDKSTNVAGEKVTWESLGVSFSGSKMTFNKASLDQMQNSPTEAAKISAFLQGMGNNEGRVRPAGASGSIQAQVSDSKIGGRVSIGAGNTYNGHLFSVSVKYNGDDRLNAANYNVSIALPPNILVVPAPGTLTVAVNDLGSSKSLTLTGDGAYAGLVLDYNCPPDDDYQAGDSENISFTYALPNAAHNFKTKVTLLSESADSSKMSLINDLVFKTGAVDAATAIYGGNAHVFDVVTINPDGTATLTMTNGDLAGLSLKVSATGGNFVPDQNYVFNNITIGSGIGNLVSKTEGLEARLNTKIENVLKSRQQSQKILDRKKERMESLLALKVNAARIQAMLIDIANARTKAISKMLLGNHSQD